MRIAHLYRDALRPGGVPEQTRSLILAQHEIGHEIVVVAANGTEPLGTQGVAKFITSFHPAAIPTLLKLLSQVEADVIHASGPLIPVEGISSLVRTFRHTPPLVLSPHGTLNPLSKGHRFGGKRPGRLPIAMKSGYTLTIVRALLRRACVAHAESAYEAGILRELGALQVGTVPMGINTDWVRGTRQEMQAPVVFTYLGRLDPFHKGLDLVLGAARRLRHRRYDFRVRLVGSDVSGSFESLQQTTAIMGLAGTVSIEPPAWDEAKQDLLDSTTYFLGVFRHSGMARACGEAIGQGIPLIATREGNWGDWIDSHKIGVLCRLDVDSLVVAMEACLVLSHEEYVAMSNRCIEFASAHQWRSIALQMDDVYERCV
jgi:glycosyltransferase involved in cell wall biosynthesis